jgi:hypothetical protein
VFYCLAVFASLLNSAIDVVVVVASASSRRKSQRKKSEALVTIPSCSPSLPVLPLRAAADPRNTSAHTCTVAMATQASSSATSSVHAPSPTSLHRNPSPPLPAPLALPGRVPDAPPIKRKRVVKEGVKKGPRERSSRVLNCESSLPRPGLGLPRLVAPLTLPATAGNNCRDKKMRVSYLPPSLTRL